jgi:hypothetical protein
MPRVGFEPTIPVFELAKMVHATDCAATVIGNSIGCSERRLTGHSFYRRNCLRQSCAARHHVLRSLISLHNEYRVYTYLRTYSEDSCDFKYC